MTCRLLGLHPPSHILPGCEPPCYILLLPTNVSALVPPFLSLCQTYQVGVARVAALDGRRAPCICLECIPAFAWSASQGGSAPPAQHLVL